MNQFVFIIGALMVMSSCKKEGTAHTPDDFTVTPVALTFKAGDTASFSLTGRPDMILFYSGELGKRYENKNRLLAAGIPKLVFKCSRQQGAPLTQSDIDSMFLLISTNLEGYDATHINKATWIDITNRNTKWPKTLSATAVTSDSIDLSEFNPAAKMNIAFRVLGKKNENYPQSKWTVQDLTLTNFLPNDISTAVIPNNFASAGWVQASLKNDNDPGTPANGYEGFNAWNVGTWNVSAADSVRNSNGIKIQNTYPITFNPGTKLNNDENDDWLITSPVDLKTTKPDAGTVIKTATGVALTNYKYIFKTPGTYTATFVALSVTDKETKEVVRQFQINVEP